MRHHVQTIATCRQERSVSATAPQGREHACWSHGDAINRRGVRLSADDNCAASERAAGEMYHLAAARAGPTSFSCAGRFVSPWLWTTTFCSTRTASRLAMPISAAVCSSWTVAGGGHGGWLGIFSTCRRGRCEVIARPIRGYRNCSATRSKGWPRSRHSISPTAFSVGALTDCSSTITGGKSF
jgi:hypothetical protein